MPIHRSRRNTYTDTGFQRRYAATAKAGAAGERQILTLLDHHFPHADIWTSLAVPTREGQKHYNSDIDIALATGRHLTLIDAKMWKAGKAYWSIFGMPMRGLAPMGTDHGAWKPLGRSMALAYDRTRQHLPSHIHLHAIVMFAATRAGAPTSVRFLRWPGGIRSYLPDDGLRQLRRWHTRPTPADPAIAALCRRLGQ